MEHLPVLLNETIEGLNIKPNGIYVDGTLGRGGHSKEIVTKLDKGRLIAIDCDVDAIDRSKGLLSEFKSKITLVHGNFRDLAKILEAENIKTVDGMLFDLGVSSPQLDETERGFSYMKDTSLDMRMNRDQSLTAYDIVNKSSEDELKKILFEYGEEKYTRSIVRKIIARREISPIETTFELNNVIISAIPASARREAQHPSKRSFQAIRIAVNNELDSLREMLDIAPQYLNHQGRLCIISFHSLEDRLVKKSFIQNAQGCTCSKKLPVCVCNNTPLVKIITRKPIIAEANEIEINPRARSAKLRVAEKL